MNNQTYFEDTNAEDFRFNNIDNHQQKLPGAVVITDEYPTDGHHGWKFIDFGPSSYQNNIQIAEHGSWNRSKKIGYRITEVTLKNKQATSYESYIDSWPQENNAVWGRPVDFFNYLTAQYSSPTIKTAPFITLLTTKQNE